MSGDAALRSPVALRAVVIALGIVGLAAFAFDIHVVLGALSGAYPGVKTTRASITTYSVQLVIGTAHIALALVIAWRVRADRGIHVGGLFLACLGLMMILPRNIPGKPTFAAVPHILTVLTLIAYVGVIRFTQLFPDPVSADNLTAVLSRTRAQRILARIASKFLNPLVLWVGLGVPVLIAKLSGQRGVSSIVGIYLGILGCTYLYTSFRLGNIETRRSILWLLENALASLLLNITILGMVLYRVMLHPQWDSSHVFWICASIVHSAQVFFVSMAIFHGSAIDSGLVVKRTAVISTAAGVVLVLFVVLEQLITNAVQNRLGVQGNTGAIVAGVAAAFAFGPVHARLKRAMDGFIARFDTPAAAV